MEFQILKISDGWFKFGFTTDNKHVEMVTTSKWGNDGPKHLLIAFKELSKINYGLRYVILDDEPGANIVIFQKKKPGEIKVKIYSVIEWYDSRIKLYGNKVPEGLVLKDEILNHRFSTYKLSLAFLNEFGRYFVGQSLKKYNENWFEFPDDDYMDFKKIIEGQLYVNVV